MAIQRRKFITWLGFGAFSSAIVLAGKYLFQPSAKWPSGEKYTRSIPSLKTIEFASIKLDSKGSIIDRPRAKVEVFQESIGAGIEITMVKIPAGKFLMGSPTNEVGRDGDESPQHLVNVREFYFSNNPAYFRGDRQLPVDSVSWIDAMDFCQKLSQQTGRVYRLPTEAQWEYACRAGTATPFAFGENITTAVANYDGSHPLPAASIGETRQQTTPVMTFPPNLLGLYDIHGNLWEWCLDEYRRYRQGNTDDRAVGTIDSRDGKIRRIQRGGSWGHNASHCRCADRIVFESSLRYGFTGFRLVCLV
jgi:eukaryotic-like serine/threonine-protein kinase